MKSMTKFAITAFMAVISLPTFAGKIKLLEGNLDALKSESEVNLEFDYSDFSVGKFDKETDYVTEKTETYNKKEPGKGDSWAKAWVADRENRYEPAFMGMFEDNSKLIISKKPVKYTIIVVIKHIEPGFNIGITRKNAEVDAQAWLVETADHGKVLAKVTLENNPGRTYGGYDFDTGLRIAEAFEYAGKHFGKFVKDKAK